jgi:hypothetical protein
MLETVFSMWSVLRSYLEDNWGDQWVVSWELFVESQPVKRRLGGWCEMAARLGVASCRLTVEFYTWGCEDRTRAREAEEFPLLEVVARERLVKTQQVQKRLSGCCGDLWIVEISDSAVITCSSEWCV